MKMNTKRFKNETRVHATIVRFIQWHYLNGYLSQVVAWATYHVHIYVCVYVYVCVVIQLLIEGNKV